MSVTRGRLSVSNISETGSGILKRVQLTDTSASDILDATISINVDGKGAEVLNLDTMYKGVGSATAPGYSSLANSTDGTFIGSNISDRQVITIPLDMPYRTSIVVTVTNADGFAIFWEEDTF